MNPTEDEADGWLFLLIILFVLLCLSGCSVERKEKAQTDTVRHETTTIDTTIPMPFLFADGLRTIDIPIHLVMQRDASEVAKTAATQSTSLQAPELTALIGAGVRTAMAQFAPGLAASFGIDKAPKDYTREIIEVIIALSGAAGAVGVIKDKNRQIEFHKNDATEGYELAKAAGALGAAGRASAPAS